MTSANAHLTEADRERMIMEHMPQVRLIARRIHDRVPGNISLEDLDLDRNCRIDLRHRPVRPDPRREVEDLRRIQDPWRNPR